MEGRITLTTSEQRRLIVLNHLESGALVNAEAARLLGLSVRQLQRMKAAYAELGAVALSHGNRGRRPTHALDPELIRRVVELATTTYAGFNRQHLTEMLSEEHELTISDPEIWRSLRSASCGFLEYPQWCLPRSSPYHLRGRSVGRSISGGGLPLTFRGDRQHVANSAPSCLGSSGSGVAAVLARGVGLPTEAFGVQNDDSSTLHGYQMPSPPDAQAPGDRLSRGADQLGQLFLCCARAEGLPPQSPLLRPSLPSVGWPAAAAPAVRPCSRWSARGGRSAWPSPSRLAP